MALAWPPAMQYCFAAPQLYPQVAPAYSYDELDQMLAPIALYPDPLLAQILPAASFGDQVTQAQQLLGGSVDEGLIENQDWDISVKAIAHYPSILNMMVQNAGWTAALGQAYIIQPADVSRSIQRLREEARAEGVLESTSQQQVIVQPNVIRIEPAQARYIYVPAYDPEEIWGYPDLIGAPVFPGGLIGFGTGLLIGAWLNRDWDWHGGGPYYHGWRGGGWVRASRRYVNTGNRFYVNNQFRNVHVDRRVASRNTSDFRSRMDRNAVAREKPAVRGAPPAGTRAVVPSTPAPPAMKPAPGPKVPPAPAAPREAREK